LNPRVGVFGGSFDPVHNAHVALARAALDALALDQVLWVPTGQAWQKARPLTAVEHRVAMVQLAIADEPRFVLDRIEVDREGPSYTIDTLRALAERRPDARWVLIIGQDQYAGLHTWHHWQEVLARVELAVANRPGALVPPHPDVQQQPHRMVPLPMLDISATDIRRRLAEGRDISGHVSAAVARYIDLHRLYAGHLGS
jgi:nicotinate-nucleotide adenylyltransferase